MATLYTNQAKNIKKTWILMTTFLVVIIGLGWFFSYYLQSPLILIIAVIFSISMNFIAYWYSDKIVLKISGAKLINREENRDLWNIVENLSITAGLPMPKLYIINDPAPNAFATGRNKEHAIVAVTTGLLSVLDKNELEGVIAHELSHIGNRDILILTVVVVLVGFITLLSDLFLRMTFFGKRGGGNRDSGKLEIILMMIGVVLAILAPLIASLIKLAVSRKREFLADASGALLTRFPQGLASALEKISQHSQKMEKANRAIAHLFIADPFGQNKKMGFIHKMFLTHPPVEDRVKALMGK
ncbi:zinc metalloprotease HtpX [Candidatus Nomurabacteria bacterium RIFCSPLOWO2_01_FULL_33_24]|uniref:Protease HtpX homolog n=1 Tax=Candidatus Nomurabacteria bacterium RIFCSPLOWO2_01_FULL_33_24 TaxID=1801765 RepID=A0A1F6X2Q6_9BACT|nr:MAG: zinc metalloprotease HtpX [Candidatus Nomurabacteria bacterium RIFCSPLOWO2_01_FULL_33_24]